VDAISDFHTSQSIVSLLHQTSPDGATPTAEVVRRVSYYLQQQANVNRGRAMVFVFILGFLSILTGLNFIVTTHKLGAPGY
jgi:hypothetical protein